MSSETTKATHMASSSCLAIVVPYYKIAFFEETLQSLADQSDQRFTVYIGDDASPENPRTLVKKFKGKFNLTYHRFSSNLGSTSLVSHWHRCLDLSHDEKWVLILGDDDVLGRNCVAEFYRHLEEICKVKLNVIRFASETINDKSVTTSILYKHPTIEKSTDFLIRKYQGKTRSSLSEYIFKKAIVEEKKFKVFPLAWHSDVMGVLEFSDFSNVYTLNNAIVKIRISDKSISGSDQNWVAKNKASKMFYLGLLKNTNRFSEVARQPVLLNIEKTYLNDKKDFFYLGKILSFYIFNLEFKRLIVFITNIFRSLEIGQIYKKSPFHFLQKMFFYV